MNILKNKHTLRRYLEGVTRKIHKIKKKFFLKQNIQLRFVM